MPLPFPSVAVTTTVAANVWRRASAVWLASRAPTAGSCAIEKLVSSFSPTPRLMSRDAGVKRKPFRLGVTV